MSGVSGLHLGFGLAILGGFRALEDNGDVAREVLIVAGISADRFRELVVFGSIVRMPSTFHSSSFGTAGSLTSFA